MARERKGWIEERTDGKIYARVTRTDSSGRRREMMRRAESRTDARTILKSLLTELEAGEQRIDAAILGLEKSLKLDVI